MNKPEVKLVTYTPRPIEVIDLAASVCYQTDVSKLRVGALYDSCYEHGHHSVIEHASFSFLISGFSRALMAQITRHRLASFSVKSQRYVDENNFEYVIPDSIAKDDALKKLYDQDMAAQKEVYKTYIKEDIPKEDSRFVLPNSCSTTIFVTMNLRELINFMNLRLCSRAQWEIRKLAQMMKQVLYEEVDCKLYDGKEMVTKYLVPSCEQHKKYPFCPESKKDSCGKHPTRAEVYFNPFKDIDKYMDNQTEKVADTVVGEAKEEAKTVPASVEAVIATATEKIKNEDAPEKVEAAQASSDELLKAMRDAHITSDDIRAFIASRA